MINTLNCGNKAPIENHTKARHLISNEHIIVGTLILVKIYHCGQTRVTLVRCYRVAGTQALCEGCFCLHRRLSIFTGSGVVMATRESFLHDGRRPPCTMRRKGRRAQSERGLVWDLCKGVPRDAVQRTPRRALITSKIFTG